MVFKNDEDKIMALDDHKLLASAGYKRHSRARVDAYAGTNHSHTLT